MTDLEQLLSASLSELSVEQERQRGEQQNLQKAFLSVSKENEQLHRQVQHLSGQVESLNATLGRLIKLLDK